MVTISPSILEDLYYGRILPFEQGNVHTEKYRELHCQIEKERAYLLQQLPHEDRAHLVQFEDLLGDLAGLAEQDTFCKAFRIGARVAIGKRKKR